MDIFNKSNDGITWTKINSNNVQSIKYVEYTVKKDKILGKIFIVGIDEKNIKPNKFLDKFYRVKFNRNYLKKIYHSRR